jgi:hypothetical protein
VTAQHENAPNQPQPERYYSEHVLLPAAEDAVGVSLRRVYNERKGRGWKLISATKEPCGDALLLAWDTLEEQGPRASRPGTRGGRAAEQEVS